MIEIGKNKKAVSAVIGVILMVAVTVAIAATVYAFVAHTWNGGEVLPSGDDDDDNNTSEVFCVEGWVIDAYSSKVYKELDGKNYLMWYVSLGANYDTEIEDTILYAMVFLDGVSAPPEDVNLRFYHGEQDTTTLMVYRVKSL